MATFDKTYSFDNRSNIVTLSTEQFDAGETSETTSTFPYTLSNHMSGTISYNDAETTSGSTVSSDANGNILTNGDATHTYDLFNRLTSYTNYGVTTTYTYYANGLRASKTANSATTSFIWDDGNLVVEKAPDAAAWNRMYVYGADGLSYRADSTTEIYTYNVNYRGDVIAVMGTDKARMAEYVFDPYGNIQESNISMGFSDNFGYRGQYHDTESGYIYLRMRYLDPETGRFITEDPIRDGNNWFAYCEGNPIKYVDLWGLAFKFDNEEDYKLFQKYVCQVYGVKSAEEITWDYDEDTHVLSGINGRGVNEETGELLGSNTGVALIGLLSGDSEEYNISFNVNMDNGSHSDGNVTIGLKTAESQNNNEEVLSRMIHEFTHIYTYTREYDVRVKFSVSNITEHVTVTRKYQEAVAMNVEKQFRKEMMFAERNANNIDYDNLPYGMWPWEKSEWGFNNSNKFITLGNTICSYAGIQIDFVEGRFIQ